MTFMKCLKDRIGDRYERQLLLTQWVYSEADAVRKSTTQAGNNTDNNNNNNSKDGDNNKSNKKGARAFTQEQRSWLLKLI